MERLTRVRVWRAARHFDMETFADCFPFRDVIKKIRRTATSVQLPTTNGVGKVRLVRAAGESGSRQNTRLNSFGPKHSQHI